MPVVRLTTREAPEKWPLYICLWGTGWRRPNLYDSAAAGAGLAVNPGGWISLRGGTGQPAGGARRISAQEEVPGPSPEIYAFDRGAVQPNLYGVLFLMS
jgi:hypothetical protein